MSTTDRRIEWLPLGSLQAAKRNPKRHSTDISTSVGRFGYVEPIILDERTGRIVAGHGRREALMLMRKRGESAPSGVRLDGDEWLVPVMRGWASRSDAEAEAYLLASNKLTEAGGWDEQELAAMVRDLDAQDALDGVGFEDDELAALLADDGGSEEPTSAEDQSGLLTQRFEILIECATETEQATLLARLSAEGRKCRSLIS